VPTKELDLRGRLPQRRAMPMKIPFFHRTHGDAPAGALFGMVGFVLAAPLTSAAVHISADLARARTAAPAAEENIGGPEPAPG
jgi:hypothetical protein